MMLTTANTKEGTLVLLGGPTAGRGGSMEACGPALRQIMVIWKLVGRLVTATDNQTADMQVSPLLRAQARCLAVADKLTGAAKWRMMR